MNVRKILIRNAELYSSKPAIIFKDNTIGFLDLKENSFKLARAFLDLGLKRQDRIAIYLPNLPEYVYSYIAGWLLGIVCVPLDFMLTQEEVVNFINHSEAKILITVSKVRVSLEEVKSRCPSLEKIILCDTEEDKGYFLSLKRILNKTESELPEPDFREKDYAIIFYTSGTTGTPKGVLVNYQQLSAPPMALEYFVDLSPKDIVLCAVPFSHLGGLVYIQAMLWFGLSFVLMERFIPLEFLKNIPKYKVTCFWIVPSMYYAMLALKEFEELDLSSLRWIVTFGASSSADALR
ncbi:MAG: acyl--CoA ligase, partial [Candidatus Omnitrophica bacterium]|nr:acyl--CoA ligase [Candidatus Omnitrophota bacterium]